MGEERVDEQPGTITPGAGDAKGACAIGHLRCDWTVAEEIAQAAGPGIGVFGFEEDRLFYVLDDFANARDITGDDGTAAGQILEQFKRAGVLHGDICACERQDADSAGKIIFRKVFGSGMAVEDDIGVAALVTVILVVAAAAGVADDVEGDAQGVRRGEDCFETFPTKETSGEEKACLSGWI